MSDAVKDSLEATPSAIRDFVLSLIQKQIQSKDAPTITGESKMTDLNMDSLDEVEVIMGIEEKFGISISEEEARAYMLPTKTVDDLIAYVVERASAPVE